MSRIKLKLKRIDPIKAGIIYAALMAIISLIIIVPISFMSTALLGGAGAGISSFGGLALLFIPVLYAVIGFLFGILGTAILNFILGKTDGLDIEFESNNVEITNITKNSEVNF